MPTSSGLLSRLIPLERGRGGGELNLGIIPCRLIHLSGAQMNGGNLAQLGGTMEGGGRERETEMDRVEGDGADGGRGGGAAQSLSPLNRRCRS